MQRQNYLGIYLSRDAATVVCLGSQGRDRNVLGCFSVSVEETETQNLQALAGLIAQGCAERGLEFSEVAVALNCAMFMQHNIHSEFDDPKQIAQTVRFDVEEALATDVTDVAMAFKITSSDQTGSTLTVFTAQRKILSDILFALQSNNIDPVTIEPDVNCLSRFIWQNVSLPEDLHPFFCVFSRRSGYFIVPILSGSQKQSVMRTFLLGPTQARGELLAREVSVTAALVETDEPISRLEVFDSTASIDYQQLGEKLGIEVGPVDLAGSAGAEPEVLADCADAVDFAIACGAALAHLEKEQSINFRNDFSPFLGKKLRLQKMLKVLSISVTLLLLALGVHGIAQLLKINQYRDDLRNKLRPDYSVVMLDQKLPGKIKEAVRKLGSEKRRIENVKEGLLSVTGEESVSARLTLVLEAFNKCAAQTNLNINSISITTKNIRIEGNTSSRANTLKLFGTIKKCGLDILQQRLSSEGGRDKFSIAVAPKNS